jgi:N-acetylglucosamine kinase-like BadF-type ATPase
LSSVGAILGVDVGGSGLRAQRVDSGGGSSIDHSSIDHSSSERFESDGAAILPGGIDLEPLLAAVAEFDSGHRRPLDVVVWSMRGLLGLSDPERVLRQVHSRLGAARTVVASDAVTSLVGALGEVRPGAVLAAGSGVVAFATDFADVWRMVDGWGHVLADRGSGAWIGLEGLRAALAIEDGVPGGSTALNAAARAAWGEPRTWPRAVMTTPDAQARLAAFAPVVAALAGADALAAQVVAQAATHLADSLESAASSVTGATATAVGGLLRIPEVSAAFEDEIRRRGINLTAASGTALDGALALGRHVGEGCALRARAPYLLCSDRAPR